jgi:hypothetical protein
MRVVLFDDIIKTLPTLPKKDLTKISALIKMLNATKSANQTSQHEDLFYKIMSNKVTELGGKYPPLQVFIKDNKNYNLLVEACKRIDDFAKVALDKPMNRLTRVKMYKLFGSLAADDLDTLGIPLGVSPLLNTHHRFAFLVNRDFPGYVKSGLLHILLK